jgi:hypothetical protein
MDEAAYAIIALGFAFLGVRLIIKFREISSWKSDEDATKHHAPGSKPRELLELKIEDPSDDLTTPEGPREEDNKGNQ